MSLASTQSTAEKESKGRYEQSLYTSEAKTIAMSSRSFGVGNYPRRDHFMRLSGTWQSPPRKGSYIIEVELRLRIYTTSPLDSDLSPSLLRCISICPLQRSSRNPSAQLALVRRRRRRLVLSYLLDQTPSPPCPNTSAEPCRSPAN